MTPTLLDRANLASLICPISAPFFVSLPSLPVTEAVWLAVVADVMAAVPGFVEEAGTALEAWRDGNIKILTLDEKTRIRIVPVVTQPNCQNNKGGAGGRYHYGPGRQQWTAVR